MDRPHSLVLLSLGCTLPACVQLGRAVNMYFLSNHAGHKNNPLNVSLLNRYSDFSITVGSHMTAGYHIASDREDSAFFFADLPLLVEINLGHNASKDFYNH